MSKERGILFSGPLVRAILEGRKTQTRRLVKPVRGYEHRNIVKYPFGPDPWSVWWHSDETDRVGVLQDCPYGKPGDRLWVRETFKECSVVGHSHSYGEQEAEWYEYRADNEDAAGPWRPSIFMPRDASRIDLEITAVRVERLKQITSTDAVAEGVAKDRGAVIKSERFGSTMRNSQYMFFSKWDEIHGEGSVKSNPYVWVIEFKKL